MRLNKHDRAGEHQAATDETKLPAHYTARQRHLKTLLVEAALRGLLSPKTVKTVIQQGGLTHA